MYDYIIVGGGTAGCALAHRLSADPDVEVLLLESGEPEEERDAVRDPTRVWDVMGSDLDWGFETEPQEHMNGRVIEWPRGKALGGSSVINGMAYVRGHPYDFDNWADFAGDDGWDYESLLPYFKKSEDFQAEGDEEYHGTGGPMTVTGTRNPPAFSDRLVEACLEVGFERNHDYNGERQSGVGYYYSTIEAGERVSMAGAFIKPVLDRPNLTVRTSAHATSLTFDGDRATGVRYRDGWDTREAEVTDAGEVIVSAGAIQSPQLLMLSGIGPADHLEELGIDVRVDLPGVGRNLQDHLRVTVGYQSPEPIEGIGQDQETDRYDRSLVGGFERSDPDRPAPDIQYGISPGIAPNRPMNEGYSVAALPLRPTSRGRLTLQSTDPFDDPVMDPECLSTERDREDIVTSVRRARRIAQADVLAEYREEEVFPGEDVQSDEEILEFAKNTAVSGYHPTCTCRMGPRDELSVVDSDLRVYGVEGLRVIDASVMPQITSGNTNAPTLAIAEKGADLVLDAR